MSLVIQQVNNVWKLVGENNMYDVVIIGAGVSGSACARELSKYNLSICVVEKEEDVLWHFKGKQCYCPFRN